MDAYRNLRSLPFQSLASALGLSVDRYKTRKGGEYYGPCPVHQPKNNTTSFSYAPDGKFHCFSCNAKGRGAIDFVKLVKNVNFTGAVELLGALPTPDPAKEKSPSAGHSERSKANPIDLTKYRKFARPCKWLEDRIPDEAVRERFGVFYYENNSRQSAFNRRVLIPVKDIEGNLHGYLGRAVETESSLSQKQDIPKYLFPKGLEKSKFLFGAAELLQASQKDVGDNERLPLKRLWLVESPFCVLKFAMYGIPALSPFGWSVSLEQYELLTKLGRAVVFLPDSNKYQEAATNLSLLAQRLWVRFPQLPDGIDDPENLTKEQILAL